MHLEVEIPLIIYLFSNPTDWALHRFQSADEGHTVKDGNDAASFTDKTDVGVREILDF